MYTSSTLDVNSFNENWLQTMCHGNYITGGVFNVNLAPAKNEVKSPEDPKCNKQSYRVFLFFIRILTFWDRKKYKDLAKPKSGAPGLFLLTGSRISENKGFGIVRVLVFPNIA